ncbi:MAG: aminotransferase class I/II-fold pyridoxal phosphate-dependent enzyme [Cyclobacteriaceae bacterium]|jgi:dTDP-4-amino-4,6-dideoxygalactose transaminase|nr:aminotransferase class I/II-fold pyridoxal phosphate-dependent enzyme [Cytophagales bacterium]MCZ8327609.1 aminotransferase class I/II-fold pyridoxal phosphate-dependent enzyme [Cyclobacteriaceae bacterium]
MNLPRVYLSPPHIGQLERQYVQEAFDQNWVSPVGPNLTAFENELARYNHIAHCAALSSGTAAIHLALIIAGVDRDDEVICSSFTFSGSSNPIAYMQATPVFIDSESITWNMDPDLLEEAIKDRIRKKGKKPKAIIVVHLYGMPAQIERIKSIAQRYEIILIEDAAEALGAKVNDQYLGTFGDFGIYSFNGNKIITTSGGGALVAHQQNWVDKARFLATQARDQAPHYEHTHIGYNYRLSNISAGIGRGQLAVLNERIAKRRQIYEWYRKYFNANSKVQFLPEPNGYFANRWLTTVLFANPEIQGELTREKVRIQLEKDNIESRPLWKPMHLQPVFKNAPAYVNGVSESLFKCGLCLPSGTAMDEDIVLKIAEKITRVIY